MTEHPDGAAKAEPVATTDTADANVAFAGGATQSAIPAEELTRLTDDIVSALKTVYDPEIPADIYELGLIYKVDIGDDQAVAIVAKDRKCSTSYIQRKLAIGYNKAARLVEQMEEQGVVSAANHVGKREVLVPEV